MASVDDATEVGSVRIKVNGITIEVTKDVRIREILAKAKESGAIEGSIEDYTIERVEIEGEMGIEETVTVTKLEEFLAVPIGKTDVAQSSEGVRLEEIA